jgi:hypothetical protein
MRTDQVYLKQQENGYRKIKKIVRPNVKPATRRNKSTNSDQTTTQSKFMAVLWF